jgi:hypothetical protein
VVRWRAVMVNTLTLRGAIVTISAAGRLRAG